MGEGFEAAFKLALRSPAALGDHFHLSIITGIQGKNLGGLSQLPPSEHNGLGLQNGHALPS